MRRGARLIFSGMVFIAQRVCCGARTSGMLLGGGRAVGTIFGLFVKLPVCRRTGDVSGAFRRALGGKEGVAPARASRSVCGNKAKKPHTAVPREPLFRVFETSTHLWGCAMRFFPHGAPLRRSTVRLLGMDSHLRHVLAVRCAADGPLRGAVDRRGSAGHVVSASAEGPPFARTVRPRTERATGERPPCTARHAGRHPASTRTRSGAPGRCQAV